MFFLNTNFDGTNIDQPLFNYLDFSFKTGLEYSRDKVTTLLLNSNEGILNDSYFGLSPTKESDYLAFYQLDNHFE